MKQKKPEEFLTYLRRNITPAELTTFILSYLNAVQERGAEPSEEQMDRAFDLVTELLYKAWLYIEKLKNEPGR